MKTFKQLIADAVELTLQYHDELNSKLWNEQSLKPEVRTKLLMIAHTWAGFAKIPNNAIVDIILVGGNANYNYTPYSDIDLHLVIDVDRMPDCKGLLDEYLRGKKQLWGLVHDIKIYGHDVELYAQDKNTEYTKDQGVYSIKNNKWIIKPTHKEVNLQDPLIQQKVEHYIEKINTLMDSSAEDQAFEGLKTKFRDMRAAALKSGGEFSVENLVFKELRNLGYLDKMSQYLRSKQDERLSL